MRPRFLLLPLLLLPAPARAQVDEVPAGKRALARRIAGAEIRLDGRLDDAAWRTAHFVSDFRQKEPVENGEPGDRTEVAFLYDADALYVGARMHSRNPGGIPRDLTRRDQYGNSEHIVVSLDPHRDRRTAYSFSVTSGGVRRDYYHPRDSEDFGARDFTYDPVWDARVQVDSGGWTAEMRIPFSQLRFADRPVQEWGLNLLRWIPGRNEDIYWVVVPRNETGFASRFGALAGLEGIRPGRRLELLPYAASSGTFRGQADAASPFDPDGRRLALRAGADLKMGLGPSMTLDATINPDFGQVEADPAEVNLSAFETFFAERRPFFTEGSQLLRSTVPSYFYSRRIGARPRGEVDGDFVDRPDFTTILGAAKVTGRLPGGLSIGALAALTGRERARVFDAGTGAIRRVPVEPRAGYGVVRLQQQFGPDASTIGAVASGVTRGFGGDSALRSAMTSRAVAGGVDWVLRFKRGEYEVSGDVGASHVAGTPAAVRQVQEASSRYFQRPDSRATSLDPTRTRLDGWRARLRGDKNAGNWLWGAEVEVESPGFETNDMGRLTAADDIDVNADVNHRWTTPGRLFRSATLGVYTRANWNFDGVRTSTLVGLFSRHTWRNFMSSTLNVYVGPRGLSDNQTRGGPLMRTVAGVEVSGGLQSSYAAATRWRLHANGYRGELRAWQARVAGGLTLRPTSALNLSVDPMYLRSREPRQYVATIEGGPAATYHRRYVFGAIDRSTVSVQVRVNFTFAPNLTVEAYGEPFAASGRYAGLGELRAPRTWDLRVYGTDQTTLADAGAAGFAVTDQRSGETFLVPRPDFNALSFRSNLVLRWEWQPGSTLFLVWQQNRSGFCTVATPEECRGGRAPGRLVGPGALGDALEASGDNFLAVKLSYWLPVGGR